jgi:RNA polymerase sigma factor (sigma-70 family)
MVSAVQTDHELLAEFAQTRSEDAFAELMKRHGAMVLGACRRVLMNDADAEDAAQAVFFVLAQKAPSLSKSNVVLGGWLHRVAWHVAQHARTSNRTRQHHERLAATAVGDAHEENPWLHELDEALNVLPEKYRTPLILHHLAGHSCEDAARLMGCKPSALTMRLVRGREMLRKKLRTPATLAGTIVVPACELSPALVLGTSKTAAQIASGQLAAIVSQPVLEMTMGGIKMLFVSQVKAFAAVLLSCLLLSGIGMATYRAIAAEDAPPVTAKKDDDKNQKPAAGPAVRRDTEELKAMAEHAETAYQAAVTRYERGLSDTEPIYTWSKRWLEAVAALNDETREIAIEQHSKRMEKLEIDAVKREAVGQVTKQEVASARYYVAEAKKWLKQFK